LGVLSALTSFHRFGMRCLGWRLANEFKTRRGVSVDLFLKRKGTYCVVLGRSSGFQPYVNVTDCLVAATYRGRDWDQLSRFVRRTDTKLPRRTVLDHKTGMFIHFDDGQNFYFSAADVEEIGSLLEQHGLLSAD
jgi:hypothetical protein